MSKESLEHLSSLMDGEFSRDSGMFLTRRMASDEALCETWERYHLIRDCIRQPGSKQVVTGLSVRLRATLQAEQSPSMPFLHGNRWLKPVSGLAIAASVALMAIVVTAPQQGTAPGVAPGTAGDVALAKSVNQPFVSPNTVQLVAGSQPASYSAPKKSEAQRLNAYLLRHNQMARTVGRQGFISFVPIVATQASVEPEKKPVKSEGEAEREAAQNK